MSHGLTVSDSMFSIREVPWHGLGDVFEDEITPEDARKKYLTWQAYKTSLHAQITNSINNTAFVVVPNKFGIVRNDIDTILGVVGGRYEIYQNEDMWDFIDMYSRITGMQLETAGSLKGGQYTWVLLKGETFEVIKNDPINKYFLFRNSFTGLVPVSTLSTNVRVVCANTLNLALNNAKNIYNVRHVSGVVAQVSEVERAFSVQNKYQDAIKERLSALARKEMNASTIKSILENEIFPFKEEPLIISNVVPINMIKAKELLEKNRALKLKRDKKVEQVLELVEMGSGSDIPGVKGTAYGVLQAIIEWVDHDRIIKTSLNEVKASKFENAMYASSNFKTQTMEILLKAA